MFRLRTLTHDLPALLLNLAALLYLGCLLSLQDRYFVQPAFDNMDRQTLALSASLGAAQQRQFPQRLGADFAEMLAPAQLAHFITRPCTAGIAERSARYQCQFVSSSFFELLGVRPTMGGTVAQSAEWEGSPRSVAISHAMWNQLYGRSPDVIGKALSIDGSEYGIAAVLPAGFAGIDKGYSISNYLLDGQEPMGLRYFLAKPASDSLGAQSLAQRATAAFRTSLQAFGLRRESSVNCVLQLEPAWRGWGDLPAEQHRSTAQVLIATALLFLVLSLSGTMASESARAERQQREMTTRVFLGASMPQLFQPILGRGFALAFAALCLAAMILPSLLGVITRLLEPEAITTGFSLFPANTMILPLGMCFLLLALACIAPHVFQLLRLLRSSAQTGKVSSAAAAGPLVLLSIQGFVLVLLGINLIHAAQEMKRIRPSASGMQLDRCWSWLVDAQPLEVRSRPKAAPEFYRGPLNQVEQAPAVESATISLSGAFGGRRLYSAVWPEWDETEKPVQFLVVGPRFFETLHQQVLWGREFSTQDALDSPRVAIVNREFQSKFITGGPPPPFRFLFANRDGAKFEVVGIVANARHHDVAEAPVPTVYIPVYQCPALKSSS